MIVRQRIRHLQIWLVLAPLIITGLVIALRERRISATARLSDIPACCDACALHKVTP